MDATRAQADVRRLAQERGTCSAPRFAGQVLAGLEMALWDVMGKMTGRAVSELLGGAVHDEIRYFGFPQGETPEEIAAEARHFATQGCEVIYVKVGQSDAIDLAIVEQTRAAIGPERRLRLDPNEHWDPLTAARVLPKVAAFDVEFVEQPSDCESLSARRQVRAASPIAIAADQRVFTLPNLDAGNQYMNHFLAWDIIDSPDLTLKSGKLPLLSGPGLGFSIDWDAVARARELHEKTLG